MTRYEFLLCHFIFVSLPFPLNNFYFYFYGCGGIGQKKKSRLFLLMVSFFLTFFWTHLNTISSPLHPCRPLPHIPAALGFQIWGGMCVRVHAYDAVPGLSPSPPSISRENFVKKTAKRRKKKKKSVVSHHISQLFCAF